MRDCTVTFIIEEIFVLVSRICLLQLQLLVDDSARLQETYPGGNAEQISQQQALVVENWGILQEKASHRREDLQAALEMFRFLAAVSVQILLCDFQQLSMI